MTDTTPEQNWEATLTDANNQLSDENQSLKADNVALLQSLSAATQKITDLQNQVTSLQNVANDGTNNLRQIAMDFALRIGGPDAAAVLANAKTFYGWISKG